MTLEKLVAQIISLINTMIPVLVAAAIVVFFYGLLRYIYTAGKGSYTKNRELIVWGLSAIFVIVSIWGILRVLCTSFIGTSC